MKLSRRGFLVSLSAAVAAATIDVLVPGTGVDPVAILQGTYEPEQLLWTPDDSKELIKLPARVERVSDGSLHNMTLDVMRLLVAELPVGFAALAEPAYNASLGYTTQVREPQTFELMPWSFPQDVTCRIRPVTLTQQRSYELAWPSIQEWAARHATYRDFERAELARCAHDFAATIRRKRLNVFGQLPIPMGISEAVTVMDRRTGLALRGVKAHDYEQHLDLLRFDLLGGHA